jgi:hypothetical protein
MNAMKKLYAILFAISLSLGLTVIATAQETVQTPGAKTPVVKHRQKRQQQRIGRGVASGELKAGEVRKLEHEQKEIQVDKHAAKADGTVTAQERKDLAKEQNKASHHIYRAKHNNRKRN